MKALLIDDEADKGWQEVLSSVLKFDIQPIIDVDTAIEEVKKDFFDLIFLDLRFGESDHNSKNLEDYGGFKILKSIRSDFYNLNYTTPIIVVTATNKAWNIFSMIENGADSFYIKEHPNFAADITFSQKNYINLRTSVSTLKNEGAKRREIWDKIVQLQKLSQKVINNQNIKDRVEEKLKIGYGVLFSNSSTIERENLLFNKENLGYIVFWSILEEIVKDTFKNNWDQDGRMKNDTWIFKNGKVFIENNIIENFGQPDGSLKVGLSKEDGTYKAKERVFQHDAKDIRFYKGLINLSTQVYAMLLIYYNWDSNVAKQDFEALNTFRNKVDFIHSSPSAIFNEKLSKNQDSQESFEMCCQMLAFLIKILSSTTN